MPLKVILELEKLIALVNNPEVENESPVKLNPAVFSDPATNEIELEPTVIASLNVHDPPTPLNITGKPIVLPFDLIVLPAEVAAKVTAFAPVVTVIPVESVRLPYMVIPVFAQDPVEPVKSKFLTALPAVTVNVAAAAPVKLNDIELDSDGVPGVIVLAVVVALVTFTAGIPYTEKLVTDVVFQTVPVDETLIEPLVPKFIAREFELFDRNVRAVKEKFIKCSDL